MGHACLQLAGVTSGLRLTSIDSGHTAWLIMHSSYTSKRGVKKSLCMINTIKTISLFLHSVSSQVCLHNMQPLYSKRSRSSYFSQVSLLIFLPLLFLLFSLLHFNCRWCGFHWGWGYAFSIFSRSLGVKNRTIINHSDKSKYLCCSILPFHGSFVLEGRRYDSGSPGICTGLVEACSVPQIVGRGVACHAGVYEEKRVRRGRWMDEQASY